jgi:hypothetical protein
MDLRTVQEPLKQGYRSDPDSGMITLTARGTTGDTPIACSVDLRSQLTCQMVAEAMGCAVMQTLAQPPAIQTTWG